MQGHGDGQHGKEQGEVGGLGDEGELGQQQHPHGGGPSGEQGDHGHAGPLVHSTQLLGEQPVPAHGVDLPPLGEQGAVERRARGEQAAQAHHRRAPAPHGPGGDEHQRGVAGRQLLPGDGGHGDHGDQQVEEGGDGHGQLHRPGDGAGSVLHLLGAVGDQLVAEKGDVDQ